jgi:hypothetical protein
MVLEKEEPSTTQGLCEEFKCTDESFEVGYFFLGAGVREEQVSASKRQGSMDPFIIRILAPARNLGILL